MHTTRFRFAALLLWGILLCNLTPARAQTFALTGGLSTSRLAHSATLLPDGKVLIAGGQDTNGNLLFSAEIFDPGGNNGIGSFTPTGNMSTARKYHTATLLPNGKVLITGGASGQNSTSVTAELYDPAGNNGAGSFTPTGSMSTARQSHTATLLSNGTVLIAGGNNFSGTANYLASAEIYDPAGNGGAGAFTLTGSMTAARDSHTSTLLPNGKALITGGANNSGAVAGADLYDPAGNNGAGSFTPTGSLNTARYSHTSTLLPNGKALIAGGTDGSTALATAEIYDPAGNGGAGSFTYTNTMLAARQNHTATLLNNGKVLITGGSAGSRVYLSSAEIFDPAANSGVGSFASTTSMSTARSYHTATLLPSGKALIAGCASGTGYFADAELFKLDLFPNLALQNFSTRQVAFWFTNGPNITGGAYATPYAAFPGSGPVLLPPNWQIVGTGDFNGDGTPDLVLDNTSTGQIVFWFTSGKSITGGTYATYLGNPIGVPAGWQIVGVGDFNGDDRPDLVLENSSTGQIAFWITNGTSIIYGAYATDGPDQITVPAGWQVDGVGDFNGDGHPDLVLNNTSTGQIAIWLANGFNITSGLYATNGGYALSLPSGWQIAAVGDDNGDGMPDLVLENLSSGGLAFWYFNGATLSGSSYALTEGSPVTLPSGWQVSGPR